MLPQTDLSELKPQGSSHRINLVSQQMFPAPRVRQEVSPEVSRRAVSKSSRERCGIVKGLEGSYLRTHNWRSSIFPNVMLSNSPILAFCFVLLFLQLGQNTGQTQCKEGRVYGSLLKDTVLHGVPGEAGHWEHEAVGHTALTGREQRETNPDVQGAFSFSFSPGPQSKWCHPHSGPTAPASSVAFLELS